MNKFFFTYFSLTYNNLTNNKNCISKQKNRLVFRAKKQSGVAFIFNFYTDSNAVSGFWFGSLNAYKSNSVSMSKSSPESKVASLETDTSYAVIVFTSVSESRFWYSRLWILPEIATLSPTFKFFTNRAFRPQAIHGI